MILCVHIVGCRINMSCACFDCVVGLRDLIEEDGFKVDTLGHLGSKVELTKSLSYSLKFPISLLVFFYICYHTLLLLARSLKSPKALDDSPKILFIALYMICFILFTLVCLVE